MTKTPQLKAIQSGSDIAWNIWLALLDSKNAKALNHAAIAQLALTTINETANSTSPEWWAQHVAVAYVHILVGLSPSNRI